MTSYKNSSELQPLFSSHSDPVAMELIHLSHPELFRMQSTLNTFIGNKESMTFLEQISQAAYHFSQV